MSLNRTLVAGASGVIVALGTQAPKVFADKSPECLRAIQLQESDSIIQLLCGPDFGNGDLFIMFAFGGAIFLVINFWKEILDFLGSKTLQTKTIE